MSQRKLLYEKGTDDTVGCWSTNYVMGGSAFLCATLLLLLYCKKLQNDENKRRFLILTASHLLLFAFASIFGGIVHQLYPHTEDYPGTPMGYKAFWRLTLMFR